MYEDYDLICILGPTACGKTKYAVDMALSIGGEIISADSRQVYRGMDIGTGKDKADYDVLLADGSTRHIPCHLVDIADAGTKYNVFQYQKDFEKVYADIVSRGSRPILCGGSGLYIEAVTKGYYLPDVPPDRELRESLSAKTDKELIAFYESMRTPHNSTDYDTRQRLIRAIEIAVYEESHPVRRSSFLPKKTKYIGLSISREERNRRIDERLRKRLDEGMVDEVRGLLGSGVKAEDLIYYGLEYKFLTLYVTGQMDYDTMVERLAIAIHQFAKRQMTWFRGMERRGVEIEWIQI